MLAMLLRRVRSPSFLVIFFSRVHLCFSSCIASVQVEQISSTRATLSWASECDSNNFNISWSHQEYLACEDKEQFAGEPVDISSKLVTNTTTAQLEDLLPYSVYLVSVRHNEDPSVRTSVTLSTEESIPQVSCGPVPSLSLDTPASLQFSWTVPGQGQCAEYQATLGYLFYKLEGASDLKSGRGLLKEDNISIAQTEINIGGLREDSDYDFYLFITNTAGEFDEEVFMKIQKKTYSSVDSSGIIPTVTTSVFLTSLLVVLAVVAVVRCNRRNRLYRFQSLEPANQMEVLEPEEFCSISSKE